MQLPSAFECPPVASQSATVAGFRGKELFHLSLAGSNELQSLRCEGSSSLVLVPFVVCHDPEAVQWKFPKAQEYSEIVGIQKVNNMTFLKLMAGAESDRWRDSTMLVRAIANANFVQTPTSAMNAVDGSDHYSKTIDGIWKLPINA